MILTALLIFVARLLDVTAETFRWIITIKRMKLLASSIAFIEVFVWIIVFRELVMKTEGWLCYLAYAGGYAAGTYLGIWLSDTFVHDNRVNSKGEK